MKPNIHSILRVETIGFRTCFHRMHSVINERGRGNDDFRAKIPLEQFLFTNGANLTPIRAIVPCREVVLMSRVTDKYLDFKPFLEFCF